MITTQSAPRHGFELVREQSLAESADRNDQGNDSHPLILAREPCPHQHLTFTRAPQVVRASICGPIGYAK